MLNKIRDYLDFAGIQYRNPNKAGEEREKMLEFRHKGQEARKALQNWLKYFKPVIQNGNSNRLVSG